MLCLNPCACHAKSVLNFKKRSKTLVILTVLISKSLSRHSRVRILRFWISKRGPMLPVFYEVDFRIDSRYSGVQIWATSSAADPLRPPVFRSWLAEPAEPQNYGKTQHFAQFLPAETSSSHTSQLHHIRAIASLCWQIFTSDSQYSRKLDS